MAEGRVSPGDRNGLVVDACLTHATGTAEPAAALAMLQALPGASHKTVGADKAYDTVRIPVDRDHRFRVLPCFWCRTHLPTPGKLLI